MATTSGTYTYSLTVTEICTAALRLVQVVGDEENPTASQLQTAIDAMSAMCKAWQGSGIHLWCEEEGIIFLQPGQTIYNLGVTTTDTNATVFEDAAFTSLAATAHGGASSITIGAYDGPVPQPVIALGDKVGIQLDAGANFWTTAASVSGTTIGLNTNVPTIATSGALVFGYTYTLPRPLRVMGGRRYQYASKLDIPIQLWARLDYEAQPNKYTPGVTTAFFYNPSFSVQGHDISVATGHMNVWPTPEDNSYGMRFTSQRQIQDLGTLANQPDFPVEWNAALKWNLAMEIGPEFGCPNEQMTIINAAATKWFDMASRWDRETESLRFGVAMQPGYRRG